MIYDRLEEPFTWRAAQQVVTVLVLVCAFVDLPALIGPCDDTVMYHVFSCAGNIVIGWLMGNSMAWGTVIGPRLGA